MKRFLLQLELQLKQKQRTAIVLLATLVVWLGSWFVSFSPEAFAAPSVRNGQAGNGQVGEPAANEQIDRAYSEFSEEAGLQEEIFQERVQQGENPEKLPQPYQRIKDLNDREVPETSLIETTVSKVRQLIGGSEGKAE